MDPNSSHADDLNELEQRLSAWQPSTGGLSPEAMLFAAGRASVHSSKVWLAWPIACACLALVTLTLVARLAAERSERLALFRELEGRATESALASSQTADQRAKAPALAPDCYLVLRRQWEEHPWDGVIGPKGPGGTPDRSGSPPRPVLRPWPLEGHSDLL